MVFIIFGMQMDKLVEKKIGMRVKEKVDGKVGTKTDKSNLREVQKMG